jgi:hypothetical protein
VRPEGVRAKDGAHQDAKFLNQNISLSWQTGDLAVQIQKQKRNPAWGGAP